MIAIERMKTEPEALLAEVFGFLGLPECDSIDRRPRNERSSQPPMAEPPRAALQEYFRPYNQELVRLTGRSLRRTSDRRIL